MSPGRPGLHALLQGAVLRARAQELRRRMKEGRRSWALGLFELQEMKQQIAEYERSAEAAFAEAVEEVLEGAEVRGRLFLCSLLCSSNFGYCFE